ncbi:type II toxin-antitoxin system PemK/MazF family toxin [Desulfotignum phosphitoxidans]|uniref:Transcriptional modulator of MazE/toxin, MazF n=2 Tax=Desulfotignum TaxID=115780 RepID=S0G2X9_9BACT|nr:type II toxin-antitoxin system PemK/MazF family toxin [Desulfotignum phosphitoxidans]EMS81235.1 transcriptional modulator of MazE/toxin, MazF [Desulfotignum phosphitoxidans DSM 13687]
MRRGDLYRIRRPSSRDPKKYRSFVVVSRQILIESRFSTVICAPVYTSYDGLSTQVPVGIDEGLKHDSAIHCDELISIPKSLLIHFIGKLSLKKLELLEQALKAALQINGAYEIDG